MTTQNTPAIFNFENNNVRVITGHDGEPWFVAKEVAKVLGYSDAEAMTRRLDEDEVENLQIVGFGNRGVNIVNESGLYSLTLGSRKPEAKRFKRWVTSEVLPSIRKTGGYIMTKPEESPEEIMARVSSDVLLSGNNTYSKNHTRL